MPRRRSRPWLSLWESWRANGETERAYAVTSLRIGAVIADGYPLSHGYHHLSNRVTPNGVGQLPGSQSRLSQRVQPALSVTAFSRASSPIGRAKGGCAAELRLQIFGIALSAFCADVVSPVGKQPGR